MKRVTIKVVTLLLFMPCISYGTNVNELYASNYEKFWNHWQALKSDAMSCTKSDDMLKFLMLTVEMLANAEVTEANAEEIENAIMQNPKCVLNGFAELPEEEMRKAVGVFLAAPTFIESATLNEVLHKAWGSGEYGKVMENYENESRNR